MRTHQPFKLRVDWICNSAYGDPVVVEMLVLGTDWIEEEPKVIHGSPDVPSAIAWAVKWLRDRGYDFWCNIDWHQRLDHTHVTLHPQPTKTREF